MKFCTWLTMILMTFFMTACGGGGGSDSADPATSNDSVATTGVTTGIAVDPYIVGAEFEEIAADGQPIQQSTKSTATGRFAFAKELSEGSTIRIRDAVKGQHGNAAFSGVIKRKVVNGDVGPVVVSPLTTLLANGMSPAAVIQMMTGAGLPGLTEETLYSDPMANLADKTGSVTAADLVPLQANMAVNTFMVANQNFDYNSPTAVSGSPASLNDIAAVIQDSLNPVLFQEMIGTQGADFTVGDLATAAANINNEVARQVRQQMPAGNQAMSSTTIDQIAANAMDNYLANMGGLTNPGTGTGGGTTTPPTTGTPDAQAIFTADCAGCHTVGTGTGFSFLAGDGALLTGKFGNGSTHNGRALSADEITAMAAYFDSQGGTADPGTGTGGGTTTPPTTGTPDAQAIFTADCAGCHTVGTGTGFSFLAGDGALLTGKFGNGSTHNGRALSADEITAMAAYFDSQGGTTDPGTGTGGGTTTPPATGSCTACHGQPPSGSNFPDTAGAHAGHSSLTDVGTTCDNCHTGATHNDWVDLGFPTRWNAQSGAATDNMDGTCSNISCHGGQRTPDWTTGNINVETQCLSCHESGTAQYNSFSSGEHNRHVERENIACVRCHDVAKLQTGHFSNLSTTAFEQAPADTLSDSLNYNGQSCNVSCHGSENW